MNKNYIIAIIGAGEGAMPIIKKAKEMNVTTLTFARDGSLAQDDVDIFIEENSFDIDFMARKCREYHVDGVMPSSESTTEVAALVAHAYGVRGNDITNGFAGRNKYMMRQRVAPLTSVRQPKFGLYDEQAVYTFPVIVKSIDSCGKQGVTVVHHQEDLLSAVSLSKEHSSDHSALIEEFLSGGQEYSIECLSNGKGNHYVIQYTQKDSAGPPHFVEIGHHQPACLSDTMKKRIDQAAFDILEVLGLNYGMAHLELKIIDDEIYFIEVGARGGGSHIPDILTPLSTGFDYFRGAIETYLGIYNHQEIKQKAYTGIYYHCKGNERLRAVFDASKDASWCVENTVTQEEFGEVTYNSERMATGYLIYCADHKITEEDFSS